MTAIAVARLSNPRRRGSATRLLRRVRASTEWTWCSTGHLHSYERTCRQQIGTLGNAGTVANFDVNYTPVSDEYPSQTPAQVVVQEGDTLRLVAARMWGDGNLWYLVADANGLDVSPDSVLTLGGVLTIPNEVVALSNAAHSFKPFNLSSVIGNTTPSQPVPPAPKNGGGCGVIGQILVAVGAIVVTAYLGPIIGNAIGSVGGGCRECCRLCGGQRRR